MCILFHDRTVRNRFRESSVKQIEASRFPLSLLLTYADILQDERRDITGSSSLALFKGVDIRAGKIVALLERTALTPAIRLRLREQLHEALSFFATGGFGFDIPRELMEQEQ